VEIGTLTNLTTLSLYRNKLLSVPNEIGLLGKLTSLYLGQNELRSVPAEIGALTNLTELDLSQNKLKRIPLIFRNLLKLGIFSLHNNEELQEPPRSIATMDVASILEYLQVVSDSENAEDVSTKWRNIKLTTIGDGGVGKVQLGILFD
jgi:Leucine-rich repeat (LRR) protein